MIDGKRVVAVVPARGGSKSIPRKNIRLLNNRPLIAWTLEHASHVEEIDRVIVSTDSDDIARVAKDYGAEVYARDPALAMDNSLVLDTVLDLVKRLKEEGESAAYGLLLEPTCPFRKVADTQSCLSRLHQDALDSVATFKPAELNPHRAWRINNGIANTFIDGSVPWLPRQQLPPAYQLSGEIYAFRVDKIEHSEHGMIFGRTGAVVVNNPYSLDIDNEQDFLMAEFIIGEGHHEQITV